MEIEILTWIGVCSFVFAAMVGVCGFIDCVREDETALSVAYFVAVLCCICMAIVMLTNSPHLHSL